MRRSRVILAMVLAAIALVAAGCSGTGGDGGATKRSGPPAKNAEVDMKDFAFEPVSVTIAKRGKVTWTNKDSAAHTVTSEGNFDSGQMAQGDKYSFTFLDAGTFKYICANHPYMEGTVVVK